MKKRHILPFILLAVCFHSWGPGQLGLAESPPVVADILKKVEAAYQQTQAFSANFQQTVSSAAVSAMSTEASGKLYYEKPRKMRWEYDKPDPQVFVANRQIAWLYVPSEKQISLSDSTRIFSHPLAQTFFDGVGALKKHYEVTLDHKQSSKDNAVLKLVPKKEDPEIKSLYLSIDLHTYRISTIEVLNALGNSNRITLDSLRAAPGLDPMFFQLEIPPSVAVIDADGRPLTSAEIDKLRTAVRTDK